MHSKFTYLLFGFILTCVTTFAQVSISSTGTTFTQDFNTLSTTGTSGSLPAGWAFLETGTNANLLYSASNGVLNSGDTYSFGATDATDRAFGTLLSGSVTSTIGASFINNSGATITSLDISYTGEQWRIGTLARADRLDFQYSLDATTLGNGTFTDVNTLDFNSPNSTGPIGALDGNATANRTAVTATIAGLNIAPGATFWIRWLDVNATGADDGLGVDDFSITASGTPVGPCTTPDAQPTALTFSSVTNNAISGSFTAAVADKYLVIQSLNNTLSATPVTGTAYTAGSSFGGGVVLFAGPALTFSATALTQGTEYFFYIFAYNDISCSGGPNYLTISPLTGSQTTTVPPACVTPAAATNLLLTPARTSISGNFTGSGANKYLVIQTSTSPFTGTVSNGSTYTVNSIIGNGKVVSYNATTSFTATGLVSSAPYYFYVYAANDACLGEPFYSTVSLDADDSTLSNEIPAGYYDAAAGLACGPLKTALNGIITAGHTQNNYGSLDDVQMLTTDDRLNDAGTATIVYDMYSDNPTGPEPYTYTFSQFNIGTGSDGEGNGWNKEHSFPNSWFSQSSSTGNFPGADLNHLFPTDMDVNSLRGNYPYGKVAVASTTTLNGSKLGTSAITFGSYSGPVFEPIDAYKGDLARATLYMVTRYQAEQPTWENYKPEGSVVMDGTTYPSIERDYLAMLLQWHNADPVSAKEIERNNEVFGYQSNRNPFIDHPEYVGLIWSPECLAALPVTLTSFDAQLVSKKVNLKWTTENPQGFSHFVVERSSNAVNFSSIGQVASSTTSLYTFTDNNLPQADLVYYRLKMVDIDGTFSYSTIVKLKMFGAAKALIYPNPVSNKLQLNFSEPLFSNSSLKVFNSTGAVVLAENISLGSNSYNTNVSNLPVGKYFVIISNNKQSIKTSFIIGR